jgi:hypothetical protein
MHSRPCSRDTASCVDRTPAADVASAAGGQSLEVQAEDGWAAAVSLAACHLVNERDDTLDDLVKSDYLHEAGCAGSGCQRPPFLVPPDRI